MFSNTLSVILSCDLRDEDEVESFLTQIRRLNAPWSLSAMNSKDALLEARLRSVYSKRRNTHIKLLHFLVKEMNPGELVSKRTDSNYAESR